MNIIINIISIVCDRTWTVSRSSSPRQPTLLTVTGWESITWAGKPHRRRVFRSDFRGLLELCIEKGRFKGAHVPHWLNSCTNGYRIWQSQRNYVAVDSIYIYVCIWDTRCSNEWQCAKCWPFSPRHKTIAAIDKATNSAAAAALVIMFMNERPARNQLHFLETSTEDEATM